MKTEILYSAKSIKIGKIANEKIETYYLDIFESNGNQQTIATGSLRYVKSYISKVQFD